MMTDLGGLNPHHAVAGFGGGLAYLPFMKPANRLAVLGAVIAGVTTAMFLTPFVAQILAHPSLLGSPLTPRSELGLAFLLGLTAMTLIPAILGAVSWVKDHIAHIMHRVFGTKGGSDGSG
jgi:hypothetical protein